MNIYAIFLPPNGSAANSLDRANLIKQGFDWEAFLLTPLWAARRFDWRALFAWIAWTGIVTGLVFGLRLSGSIAFLLYVIGSLAFGLEADLIEQAQLSRTGFLFQGLTFGGSSREAELAYFCGRNQVSPPANPQLDPGHSSLAKARDANAANEIDLLGLFSPGGPNV